MILSDSDLLRLREKVEVLNGERGDRARHALRVGATAGLQEYIAALRKDATALQGTIAGLTASVGSLQASLGAAEDTVSDLAADLAGLTALSGTVAALATDLDAAEVAVAGVAGTVSTIQADATVIAVAALTATTIGGAPTAADYNKVVADLGNLRNTVAALRAALV